MDQVEGMFLIVGNDLRFLSRDQMAQSADSSIPCNGHTLVQISSFSISGKFEQFRIGDPCRFDLFQRVLCCFVLVGTCLPHFDFAEVHSSFNEGVNVDFFQKFLIQFFHLLHSPCVMMVLLFQQR